MSRSPDEVRKEIAGERERLATSVNELRGSLREAANIKARVKSKLPVVAGAAAVATVLRTVARRSRRR